MAEKPGLGEIDRVVIERFLKPDAKVLDAGCGAGRLALGLWEIGFRKIDACDFAPPQAGAARDLIAKRGAEIAVHAWDFSSLPGPDAWYDAVICLGNTLDELFSQAEREAVVKEFARVVRQGGHLIFSLQCGSRQTELEHILNSPRFVPAQGWNGGVVTRDVGFGQVTSQEIESFGFRCYLWPREFRPRRLDDIGTCPICLGICGNAIRFEWVSVREGRYFAVSESSDVRAHLRFASGSQEGDAGASFGIWPLTSETSLGQLGV